MGSDPNRLGPAGANRMGSDPNGGELGGDATEAFAEKGLATAEPDAQIALQPDVRAGDDQRALVDPHALGDRDAGNVRAVADERDGARLRLAPGQATVEARHPLARDRQVVLKDRARTRVAALAILRLDGNARQTIGELVGTN